MKTYCSHQRKHKATVSNWVTGYVLYVYRRHITVAEYNTKKNKINTQFQLPYVTHTKSASDCRCKITRRWQWQLVPLWICRKCTGCQQHTKAVCRSLSGLVLDPTGVDVDHVTQLHVHIIIIIIIIIIKHI